MLNESNTVQWIFNPAVAPRAVSLDGSNVVSTLAVPNLATIPRVTPKRDSCILDSVLIFLLSSHLTKDTWPDCNSQ